MTVSAILKGPQDAYGKIRVFIRINNGRVRKFKSTPIKVRKSEWSNGLVNHTHSEYKKLNTHLKALLREYEAGGIETEYKGGDFKKYVYECLNQWEKTKARGTIKQITTEYNKVLAYDQPNLLDITPQWLEKYQRHLHGYSNNAQWKSFKFLRLIIIKAHREKLIKDNPFLIFRMPRYKDPTKIFLSKEEVLRIEENMKDAPDELKIAGYWFVIACYTGLRFSDLVTFDKKKIKNGRLIIYTAKTGELVSIGINDRLDELFKKVGYKPLPYGNTHYNRLLKSVGQYCEISETLTSHVARHTCATMLASAGVGIEVTAKILGHSSIKTTGIYYRITGDKVDEAMSKLF